MQWKNSNTASIKIDFNMDGILNYTAVVLCTSDTAHQTTSITFGTVYCVGFQENVVQKYIFIANIDGALTIYQPHIYYTPSTANSHRLINTKCVVSFDFCRVVVLIVCSMTYYIRCITLIIHLLFRIRDTQWIHVFEMKIKQFRNSLYTILERISLILFHNSRSIYYIRIIITSKYGWFRILVFYDSWMN
jgi:hypothetical protein